ncbi:MAG: hypothetical protein K5848_02365 [Lachnospiraceae bacterium]|nr:hypothetical protein [Lachnospiraceae bacterium]
MLVLFVSCGNNKSASVKDVYSKTRIKGAEIASYGNALCVRDLADALDRMNENGAGREFNDGDNSAHSGDKNFVEVQGELEGDADTSYVSADAASGSENISNGASQASSGDLAGGSSGSSTNSSSSNSGSSSNGSSGSSTNSTSGSSSGGSTAGSSSSSSGSPSGGSSAGSSSGSSSGETVTTQPTATPIPEISATEFQNIVRTKMFEYISSERGGTLLELSEGNEFAQIRAGQIVTNFSHSAEDIYTAAIAAGIDKDLYEYYGLEMEVNDSPTVKSGDKYYSMTEAIVQSSSGITLNASVADAVAAKLVQVIKSSSSHWSYVGNYTVYKYASIGIVVRGGATYAAVEMWYEE